VVVNPAEINQRVAECTTKLNTVCEKEHIFKDSMKDAALKKKYYLKMMNDFQIWLEQSKVILPTLQPDEVQQNMSDFVQTCQDYTNKINEFLYWVEGKTPPGGFSITNPDTHFEEVMQRK
jgi:hypothetical protein